MNNHNQYQKLPSIPYAASMLGIKPHSLRRAVKLGLVPSYSPFNKRLLVRPNEVLDAMALHREVQK